MEENVDKFWFIWTTRLKKMLFHLDILLFILLTKTQIKWIHNIFMDVQIMCKSISLLRLLLYVIMFIDWKTEAACNFIKKETLAHVFSCEFCEISKSNLFTEHLWTTASRKRFITSWGSTLSSLPEAATGCVL